MEESSYLCPFCDHEVIVGMSCAVCKSEVDKKRKKKVKVKPKTKRYGWESDGGDGLDLYSEEDYDYDSVIENEFGKKAHQKIGIKRHWWYVALVLIIIALLYFVLQGSTLY